MPEVRIKSTKIVTLILTEEEATWLRSVLQNPLNGVTPLTEDEVDRTFRISLFESLSGV